MKRNKMLIAVLFIIYVCLSAGGLILFKLGSNSTSLQFQTGIFNLNISLNMILGILCYACSFVLWLVIVGMLDLSFAMPLSVGLVNLLVLIGSSLVLNETITVTQWIGVSIIIFGLFIVNVGK